MPPRHTLGSMSSALFLVFETRVLTQAASHSPVSVSEARHLIVSVLVMTGSEFDHLGSDTHLATNFVNILPLHLACL